MKKSIYPASMSMTWPSVVGPGVDTGLGQFGVPLALPLERAGSSVNGRLQRFRRTLNDLHPVE